MRILHILTDGNIGGIENLCKDYTQYSKYENIVMLLFGEGALVNEIKNKGVEIINLHANSNNILGTIHRFLRICVNKRIDKVVAHHAAPLSHLCLLAAKRKIPNISTVAYAHGNAVDMCRAKDKKGLKIRRYILSRSLKKADRVVAISNSVKCSLMEYLCTPEEKITIIYNGVNTNAFVPGTREKTNSTELIYVGRLIEEKGVQNILYALSGIDANIEYRFRIVGDGPYRKELESIAKKCNLNDKVDFCGNRRDIPQLLQSADIFVHMPNWEEGFGITVVEAMAAGKICIVADSGAMPEIISDGVNGYLVEKGNTLALAEKIQEVAEKINSGNTIEISKNAVKRARDFSIEKYANDLDALIMSI